MTSTQSQSQKEVIRLDDRNSRITYTPTQSWGQGGGDSEYLSTTTGTTTSGARMQFMFNGTYLAVYGTITDNLNTLPVSNIFTLSSDSNPSVHVSTWETKPIQPVKYNTKFYETPADLGYGMWTLTMHVGVTGSATWIDYVEFLQGSPGTTSTTDQAGPTRSSRPGPGAGKNSISSGAIAGIAVGCAALVILVVALAFFWWKRRSRRREWSESNSGAGPSSLPGLDVDATQDTPSSRFLTSTSASNLSSGPSTSTSAPSSLYQNYSSHVGPSHRFLVANPDSDSHRSLLSGRHEKQQPERMSISEQPPPIYVP